MSTRGFTLIELLVVIAIIGILATVIFASLGSVRSKGSDAGVLANVNSIVTQSVLYLGNNNGTYGTFDNGAGGPKACPTSGTGSAVFYDPTIERAVASALSDSGGQALCFANPAGFAIAISRPAAVVPTRSYFWCADSTGAKCGNDGANGDGATPIVGGVCQPCTINH